MKVFFLLLLIVLSSCASKSLPPKRVQMPFAEGTSFVMSRGPFGKASHSETGNEFSWDFDVPYGTPVLAVEDGTVLQVWEPRRGGGCDPKFSDSAHNVKIEHSDGTVAQYVHIEGLVSPGLKVRRGDIIGKTSMNGFICSPQLHFGIYKTRNHLYTSPQRQTIPLVFEDFLDSGFEEGQTYIVK